MSNFAKLQETRRTIYALGKDLPVSNEEVVALVEKAMKESPSAFNSQSSRAVYFLVRSQKLSGTKLPTANWKK